MKSNAADFSGRVIAWQKKAGRAGLPWQGTRDPYLIWLSEVMLQQTQVATVIPYYERFIARFPGVESLAMASEDQVLELWSGLGYYSRGRNLHRAARQVVAAGGRFPDQRSSLEALPGVGRSTAAAIAAFATGSREAILDGNVRRVLARCFAVPGYPGLPRVEKTLWELAETLVPENEVETYTQGLMDLGATVCTRSQPQCGACPLATRCEALRRDQVERFPSPRPKRAVPRRATVMMAGVSRGRILLVKRPPSGIWGGLWSLPEFVSTSAALEQSAASLGFDIETHDHLEAFEHRFTHFSLIITPLVCRGRALPRARESASLAWVDLEEAGRRALPAPVRRLIGQLQSDTNS